jgi:acyl-CoA dehydrogenase
MNETSRMMGELADRILGDLCGYPVWRDAERDGWDRRLWARLDEVGLPRATVPAASGGAGATLAESMSIARAAGRHALPAPLVETVLANALVARTALVQLDGPVSVSASAAAPALRLANAGADRWTLSGNVPEVPWGDAVPSVAAVAVTDAGDEHLVVVDPGRCRVVPARSLALESRATLEVESLPVEAQRVRAGRAPGLADALRSSGAMARCQQMVGAMEWLLERTVAYVGERSQFGRPISGFQAVQHLVAQMSGQVCAAAAAADSALQRLDEDAATRSIAFAKARVGEAAGLVADIAHQVHGAIGYSHEYPLHFRTRRLWVWRDEFGSERHWQIATGRAIAAAGGGALWPGLTAT